MRTALGEKGTAAESRAALAALALEEGQAANAEALAREAIAVFEGQMATDNEANARAVLALALAGQGRQPAAAREASRARALMKESQNAMAQAASGHRGGAGGGRERAARRGAHLGACAAGGGEAGHSRACVRGATGTGRSRAAHGAGIGARRRWPRCARTPPHAASRCLPSSVRDVIRRRAPAPHFGLRAMTTRSLPPMAVAPTVRPNGLVSGLPTAREALLHGRPTSRRGRSAGHPWGTARRPSPPCRTSARPGNRRSGRRNAPATTRQTARRAPTSAGPVLPSLRSPSWSHTGGRRRLCSSRPSPRSRRDGRRMACMPPSSSDPLDRRARPEAEQPRGDCPPRSGSERALADGKGRLDVERPHARLQWIDDELMVPRELGLGRP